MNMFLLYLYITIKLKSVFFVKAYHKKIITYIYARRALSASHMGHAKSFRNE